MSNEMPGGVDGEEWVSMSEAARELGLTVSKLSRMVRRGGFKTAEDPYDTRVILVDLNELRQKLPGRKRRADL